MQRKSQSFLQMLEDVRRELQIERAAHHADFVLEDDEHARQSVMGPRHEVCWIWGDDIASEQDAALAGSGPDTAAAQQVSAPQAAVNALLSDPALPTDRLVLEVDIKTCTILALSPGVECFYKQIPIWRHAGSDLCQLCTRQGPANLARSLGRGRGHCGANPRASLLETVQQGQGDKGRSARADKQRFCATPWLP